MTRRPHPLMAEARRIREAKGITQGALGARAGFDLKCVNRWENGWNQPSLAAFEMLLESLGCHLTIERIEPSKSGVSV